jgi:hypothetical protein
MEPAANPAPAVAKGLDAPAGAVDLALRAFDGVLPFVALLELRGEVEFAREGSSAPPRASMEQLDVELRFRLQPTTAPTPGDFAALAVLDALRHETRRSDPAVAELLEIADDRMRLRRGDKVVFELRGAQPREKVTPRMLLNQPFAVVHQPAGEPRPTVLPRGSPPVRGFYRPIPARALLRDIQVARPDHPVAAGATWTAARAPAGPLADVGLELPVEHQLAGFEKIGEATCAWILLRASLDQPEVRASGGQSFERVVATLRGAAWIDVSTAALVRLDLEEDVRAAYSRAEAAGGTRQIRGRYRSHLRVDRTEGAQRDGTWANGSARFSRF